MNPIFIGPFSVSLVSAELAGVFGECGFSALAELRGLRREDIAATAATISGQRVEITAASLRRVRVGEVNGNNSTPIG